MALIWREEDLKNFFGCETRTVCEGIPGKEMIVIDYSGTLLNYSFWFQITDEYVMVSGNDSIPFGADSLYEIVVPCDSVSVCEDPYDPGKTGLQFWYGDPNQRMNLTMVLLKRQNGDLKVWPTTVWPNRHPYQQSWLLSDPNASKRYDVKPED